MMATPTDLRSDAERIWRAAIDAVDPVRLLADAPVDPIGPLPAGRVLVVGAGKAAEGMAAGVEAILARRGFPDARIAGLVSVPEGSPRRPTRIDVVETRPAGANRPTPAVVEATRSMLAALAGLGADDLAVAVITGGGSALLAAPEDPVTLDDKIAVTDALSRRGAAIADLNAVRRAVSGVKAGGLARACTGGRMAVLVLSDVIGDPLDLIASGPCMPSPADPRAALAILDRFGLIADGIAPRLVSWLRDRAGRAAASPVAVTDSDWVTPTGCRVTHRIVGGNSTALAAAAAAAQALGYAVGIHPARPDDAPATTRAGAVGMALAAAGADLLASARGDGRPRAWIEGGEATVAVPADHGLGGRNQQSALAAAAACPGPWPEGLLVASIGTDGEDGPTDAAGGCIDAEVARRLHADPAALHAALARCDSLPALDRAGGLVRTGPTGTNVADVRIILARP